MVFRKDITRNLLTIINVNVIDGSVEEGSGDLRCSPEGEVRDGRPGTEGETRVRKHRGCTGWFNPPTDSVPRELEGFPG